MSNICVRNYLKEIIIIFIITIGLRKKNFSKHNKPQQLQI